MINRNQLASTTAAIAFSATVFSLTFFFAGCVESTVQGGNATSAKDIEAARQNFVASDEPTETVTVDEFFATATGADKVAEGETPPSSTTLTTEPVEVALMGRIGGAPGSNNVVGSDFPWHKGKAAFVMSDPSADFDVVAEESDDHEHAEEGHDDAHEESAEDSPKKSAHKDDCPCPFCASGKTAPPQAVVQFLGENGEPVAIDARELFDLKGDEIVVVEGTARLLVGMLMVDAKKIYVRR